LLMNTPNTQPPRAAAKPSTKSTRPAAPQGRKIDLAAVRAVAEPVAVAHGLELVDVEWASTHHGMVLRVIIERPLSTDRLSSDSLGEPPPKPSEPTVSGVALGDCVGVSRDLSAALDANETIDAKYNLEVSSPGLDRPLTTTRDFRRQLGRLAKIKLVEPAADGQQVLRGTIQSVGEDESRPTVCLLVDGNVHEVTLENVQLAKLVFELPSQPKKTGQPKTRRSDKDRANKAGTNKGRKSKRGSSDDSRR
jgi:ribosome maturation factor RimP